MPAIVAGNKLLLTDTSANRKQAEALLTKIRAKILLGEFDYAEFFPREPLNKPAQVSRFT